MATVTIKNIESYWDTSPEEDGIIQRTNSAEVPGNRFVPSFRNRCWDGYVEMYNLKRKTLPSGLVPETIQALAVNGFHTEVHEDSFQLEDRPETVVRFELSDHQLRAVTSMMENSRGIVHAATNSGKTKIAEAWCALNDCNVLYLVPTRELLNQTIASFKKDTNLEVGCISAGTEWIVTENGVTVCLVSSVIKRKSSKTGKVQNEATAKRFQEVAAKFQAVIVDECHHSTAPGWRWVLRSLLNCRYRFGLSGTPWTEKNEAAALRVKAYIGPVICKVSNDELIQKSWSAVPKIYMIPVDGVINKPIPGTHVEFVDIYENGIVYNNLRNSMVAKLCEDLASRGKNCLVIIHRIIHGEILSGLLSLKGVDHRVITSEVSTRARKEDLLDFKNGRFPILISNVMGEGVDIPSLNGLIFASGGKDSKSTLQRVGRGLRKKLEGLNEVEIYDFLDEGIKCLLGHSRKRMQIYKKENFQVLKKTITF